MSAIWPSRSARARGASVVLAALRGATGPGRGVAAWSCSLLKPCPVFFTASFCGPSPSMLRCRRGGGPGMLTLQAGFGTFPDSELCSVFKPPQAGVVPSGPAHVPFPHGAASGLDGIVWAFGPGRVPRSCRLVASPLAHYPTAGRRVCELVFARDSSGNPFLHAL